MTADRIVALTDRGPRPHGELPDRGEVLASFVEADQGALVLPSVDQSPRRAVLRGELGGKGQDLGREYLAVIVADLGPDGARWDAAERDGPSPVAPSVGLVGDRGPVHRDVGEEVARPVHDADLDRAVLPESDQLQLAARRLHRIEDEPIPCVTAHLPTIPLNSVNPRGALLHSGSWAAQADRSRRNPPRWSGRMVSGTPAPAAACRIDPRAASLGRP